jgi:hypothetical protein
VVYIDYICSMDTTGVDVVDQAVNHVAHNLGIMNHYAKEALLEITPQSEHIFFETDHQVRLRSYEVGDYTTYLFHKYNGILLETHRTTVDVDDKNPLGYVVDPILCLGYTPGFTDGPDELDSEDHYNENFYWETDMWLGIPVGRRHQSANRRRVYEYLANLKLQDHADEIVKILMAHPVDRVSVIK